MKDRYLITNRKLGVGGHGTVYLAVHRKTQRQLACKVIDLPRVDQKCKTNSQVAALVLRFRGTNVLSNISAQFLAGGGKPRGQNLQRPQRSPELLKNFREFDILQDLSHVGIATRDDKLL